MSSAWGKVPKLCLFLFACSRRWRQPWRRSSTECVQEKNMSTNASSCLVFFCTYVSRYSRNDQKSKFSSFFFFFAQSRDNISAVSYTVCRRCIYVVWASVLVTELVRSDNFNALDKDKLQTVKKKKFKKKEMLDREHSFTLLLTPAKWPTLNTAWQQLT